jgi:hypothetical protein
MSIAGSAVICAVGGVMGSQGVWGPVNAAIELAGAEVAWVLMGILGGVLRSET